MDNPLALQVLTNALDGTSAGSVEAPLAMTALDQRGLLSPFVDPVATGAAVASAVDTFLALPPGTPGPTLPQTVLTTLQGLGAVK